MVSSRWGLRLVEFIGTDLSDYLGFIGEGSWPGLLRAIFGHLRANSERWDLINLVMAGSDPQTVDVIRETSRAEGLAMHHRVYSVAPYLPIRETWGDYLRSRSGNFRYTLQRKEKRFRAHPGAAVRRLEPSEISPDIVERLWQVERKSWKLTAGTPQMRTQTTRSFYAAYLREFSRRGWVEIWLASVKETPIAYLINFVYQNRVLFYNGAFDSAYSALSPGAVLFQRSIQDAFDRKAEEYDFLAGDEPYKHLWAAEARPILQIVLSKPQRYSRLLALVLYRGRWRLARSEWLRSMHAWLIRVAAHSRLERGGG